ncbi:MAG TPA: family 78 glycoside hydrolase catalytic domain [Jiangellaceae bacterium]|nr:family 78 glycoside hydrolase catalytic domain [Jiangellaceae bacterium]
MLQAHRFVPTVLVALLVMVVGVLPSATPVAAQDDGSGQDAVSVAGLTVERAENPLGIDEMEPRLGWRLDSSRRATMQTAYQVRVATSAQRLADGNADVWDSGRVESDESVDVAYDGPTLQARQRYHWQVRVWDDTGGASAWSEPAWWEMGLVEPGAWTADWIRHDAGEQLRWADLTVEAELIPRTSAPAGVFFRADGPENAYAWQLHPDGPSLRKLRFDAGEMTELGTTDISDVVDAEGFVDQAHTLQVSAQGEEIVTRVDGEVVDTHLDDTHAGGLVGMSLGTRHGLSQNVEFTSFTVNGEDAQFSADFTEDRGNFTGGEIGDGSLVLDGVATAFLVPGESPEPLLRTTFRVDKPIERARMYSSALGLYELSLNGERIGDHEFAPGWTDYEQRIQYQTYDVTDLLSEGDNAVGAMLADGWYAGHLGFFGAAHYGLHPHLIAQLHIDYADGSSAVVSTDDTWTSADGPITSADNLMGESYDARQEHPGWNTPEFDADSWSPVLVGDDQPTERLVAQADPPVRVVEEIEPVSVTEPEPGVFVYDMGQNMVGSVRIQMDGGEPGETVRLRHGEILDPDGMIYTENLRTARATDTYTLAADEATYQPRFTFHGFRYVEVTGYPGEPDLDAVTGRVIHTDAPFTSELDTSSDLVNQLQQNIVWGQRGNFLSIPTDTPARDERMGWTGDMNVFISTAAHNMDVRSFMDKYLTDMRDAQDPSGAVADVAPDIPVGRGHLATGVAGWADAAVTLPWTLWQRYGDTQVIDENYEMMDRWVDYMVETSNDLIRPAFGYGDHLNDDDDTPRDLIGTAYMARSAGLLADMAEATGRDDDASEHRDTAGRVTEAFIDEFVTADGKVGNGSQTGYVLALAFDLVPEDLRDAAAEQLVDAIAARDQHLSTGFLGTEHLFPVLTETGNLDVAYDLLLNETYPSWGYQINLGATTMWERWDSFRPENGFQSAGMNSFNHFPFGSVGNWLFTAMAGINADPANPGYRNTIIRPRPGEQIQHADATYESAYGPITSAWQAQDDGFTLDISVPANTTATVHVPTKSRWAVTEGGSPAADAEAVEFIEMSGDAAVFEVGSGDYNFAVDPTLGALGDAHAGAATLVDRLAELESSGELEPGQTRVATRWAARTRDQAEQAYNGIVSQHEQEAVRSTQRALSATDRLRDWIDAERASGRLPEPVAKELGTAVESIGTALSRASADLLSAELDLATAAEVVAGDTVPVEVSLHNTGDHTLTGVDMSLNLPDGWSSVIDDPAAPQVEPGAQGTATFDVEAPASAEPEQGAELSADVVYSHRGGTAELSERTSLDVVSPLTITDVSADPAVLSEPGETTTVEATVSNAAASTTAGDVALDVPTDWSVEPSAHDVAPGAGQSDTVEFTVTSGAEPAGAELVATARYGTVVGDTSSLRVPFLAQEWTFETAGEMEGWKPVNMLTDATVTDGWFSMTSTGPDPWLVQRDELSIDGSSGVTVELSMQTSASGAGEVFYGTADAPGFSPERSAGFEVTGGDPHTYAVEIPPTDSPLTELRLDPLDGPGDISIDSIRVLN